MDALLAAVTLQLVAGIAAFIFSKSPKAATVLGAGGAALGCLIGLVPTWRVLVGGAPESLCLTWDAAHGAFCVGLDELSAFFLLPVLLLSALAAVYGGNYLFGYRHQKRLGSPWFFFNVFVAGMELVVIARTAFLFLFAWEVMSLAAYCLVTFEHEKAEVRRAGWIYLIATHLGVAFLLFAFMLLARQAGSLEFAAFRWMPALSAGGASVLFVLAAIGFGAKAGFVPFHVWLPEAHPAAPSHVSALMSGVMIKMGFYGMFRVLTFLGRPAAWWGPTIAAFGLLTGVVGISLALEQRDVKRTLAYSSIENMGLIGLALGVGLWGQASELPVVAVLGMTAALLHIWNHALMKGLLFFSVGSVLHGSGTQGHRTTRWFDEEDAVDRIVHDAGVRGDCRTATVERFCQRMADVFGTRQVRTIGQRRQQSGSTTSRRSVGVYWRAGGDHVCSSGGHRPVGVAAERSRHACA